MEGKQYHAPRRLDRLGCLGALGENQQSFHGIRKVYAVIVLSAKMAEEQSSRDNLSFPKAHLISSLEYLASYFLLFFYFTHVPLQTTNTTNHASDRRLHKLPLRRAITKEVICAWESHRRWTCCSLLAGSPVLVVEVVQLVLLLFLLLHRLQPARVHLLLRGGDQFQQFLLPAVPLDLGAFPLVHLLPVALQLALAALDFLVDFLLPVLLVLQFAHQGLVLLLQTLALLDDAVDAVADGLHLLLETLGLVLLDDCGFELQFEGLEFFLVAHAGGLDHEEEELGTFCGVLLLDVEEGLVVVDGHVDLLLQRAGLQLQLLRVEAEVALLLALLDLAVVFVTHQLYKPIPSSTTPRIFPAEGEGGGGCRRAGEGVWGRVYNICQINQLNGIRLRGMHDRQLPAVLLRVPGGGFCADLRQPGGGVRQRQGRRGHLQHGRAQALTDHEISGAGGDGRHPGHLRHDRLGDHRAANHLRQLQRQVGLRAPGVGTVLRVQLAGGGTGDRDRG